MPFRTLLCLSLLWVACTAEQDSVAPGINEAYLESGVGPWVERFEREGREVFDRRHEIVALCAIAPGESVADVGAGTGLFAPLLADAVGDTGTVYAVDIIPRFVEHIEQRAAELGLDNVHGVLGTERSVELPDASIDLAFVCDTYHHFEYPQPMLASIRRALRSGGRLVVVEFVREPGVSSQWILEHVRAGKATFRAEIEAAGFELIDEPALLRDNYVLRFRRP